MEIDFIFSGRDGGASPERDLVSRRTFVISFARDDNRGSLASREFPDFSSDLSFRTFERIRSGRGAGARAAK